MARVPNKLLDSVDVIYIGDFPDFKRRDINAYYDSGAIFVTNKQDDDKDMIDDIVHEIAHGVEERYNDFIYSDNTLEKEFFAKRQALYRIMKAHELNPLKTMITDSSFNQELDDYFYEESRAIFR